MRHWLTLTGLYIITFLAPLYESMIRHPTLSCFQA